MLRILVFVLGLALVSGVAYYAITQGSKVHASQLDDVPGAPEVGDSPHETLQNVRAASKRIEDDEAKRLEEMDRKVKE